MSATITVPGRIRLVMMPVSCARFCGFGSNVPAGRAVEGRVVRDEDRIGPGPASVWSSPAALAAAMNWLVGARPGRDGLGAGDLLRLLGLRFGARRCRLVLLAARAGGEQRRRRDARARAHGFSCHVLLVRSS